VPLYALGCWQVTRDRAAERGIVRSRAACSEKTRKRGVLRYASGMSPGSKLVGYARCSTDSQDLTAQRDALIAQGVSPDRIYVDHGLTGTDRKRPGLREAMAACHEGSTLVVTKLDRLARSVRDAGDIADELTRKGVKLSIGGSVHDPTDPFGKLLFNALAMIAEFEVDLSRLRTREGMKVAKEKGRLKGKQPKLSAALQKHLVQLYNEGGHTSTELAELLQVGRSTVYRTLARAKAQASAAAGERQP